MNYDNLTIANFQERFGNRFRMTKEQKTRNISREAALVEWIAQQKSNVVQEKLSNKIKDREPEMLIVKPSEPDPITGLLPGDLFRVIGEKIEYRFAYRHISGIIRAETVAKDEVSGRTLYVWIDRRAKVEKVKNVI